MLALIIRPFQPNCTLDEGMRVIGIDPGIDAIFLSVNRLVVEDFFELPCPIVVGVAKGQAEPSLGNCPVACPENCSEP